MKSALLLRVVLFAVAVGASAGATTNPTEQRREDVAELDAIDRSVASAMGEGRFAFCSAPEKPLGLQERRVCPLARVAGGQCDALAAACADLTPRPGRDWLSSLASWVAPVAGFLLYVLALAVVFAIVIPVIGGVRRRQRERKALAEPKPGPNRAVPLPAEASRSTPAPGDPETTLARAEEHRARGELDRALALYLHASLAALDRRGALRLAPHSTNGEYVRACTEPTARGALRDIVREVDAVEFGGAVPAETAASRVAGHATSIVRATARTTLAALGVMLLLGGCTPARPGSDAAGDELPREVLRRNGFDVGDLATSLATVPVPTHEHPAPVLVVDLERVSLEANAAAHLAGWVEAGGRLVVFGRLWEWSGTPAPASVPADTSELAFHHGRRIEHGAAIGRAEAFAWSGAVPVASLGDATYAASRRIGAGTVLLVANDDLFTNVGMLPPRNAAALVTLVTRLAGNGVHEVRIARAEDGVAPPSNPFAALLAAHLGIGAWHALAASLILILAYGRRRARPLRGEEEARRAFAEHVEATGALYDRAAADAHALAMYGRFVETRLSGSIPRGSTLAQYLVSRAGATPDRVVELCARAAAAKADTPVQGDEIALLEELRRLYLAATR